ncbi:MAG: Ig-like domain-containing protein [Vicinamibacterales bacterium]
MSGPQQVLPGADVTIVAAASDNVGVANVHFDVEGFPASDDTTAPYERTIHIPDVASPGATILVKGTATDAAGNKGVDTLTITIGTTPDTIKPTLTLQHPDDAAPGASILLTAIASDNSGIAGVTFFVDGISIADDTQTPYQAQVAVPQSATPGSSIVVAAEARDFAGNTTREEATVTIVAGGDTTPPVLTLSIPENARPGSVVTIAASATDASGVANVVFLADGAPLGAVSTSPYSMSYTVPANLPAGARIQLEARATDFAGQEAHASKELLVISADTAAGLVIGEVFDDTTGLPVADAVVNVLGVGGLSTTTDERGRFAVSVDPGAIRLRITKTGWTSAYRLADVQSGSVAELFDARLTPLANAPVNVTPVLGGRVTAGSSTLSVPAGAVANTVALSLVPIGQHGLAGLTPLGWSPVSALSVEPRGTAFLLPATLDVPVPAGLQAGTTLTLAAFDVAAGGWRVAAQHRINAGETRLVADVNGAEQFAWLRADTVPEAPAAPQVGGLLPGVSPVALSATAVAAVTPQPKVMFYQPGVRSDVSSAVTPGTPVPSGTPLQTRISEHYDFVNGTSIQRPPVTQDLAFFQDGALLQGRYPVTPSLAFDGATLSTGVIGVDVLTPATTTASALVTASGAHVSLASGEALDVNPEATGGPRAVQVDRLESTALGITLPSGLEFLGGLSLSLTGAPLNASAALSIPNSGLTSNDQILLLQLTEVADQSEFVLVGLGVAGPSRITSSFTLPVNALPFPGIRTAGRYLFVRATTPLGFAAGRVLGAGNTPIAGARVSVNDLGVIALSSANGYIAAGKVGALTVSALDIPTSDKGTAASVLASRGAEIALDVLVVPQPPQITSTQPTEGAGNVPLFSPITIVFSKPVDPATATGSNASRFALSSSAGVMSGTVSLSASNTVATFWPASPLASNTPYTFTIAPGVMDKAGRPLGAFALHYATLNVLPPTPPPAGSITATIPGTDGLTTVRGSQGTAGLHDIVTIENLATGAIAPVLLDPNGGFEVRIAAGLKDKLRLHIVSPANVETIYALPLFSQTNADGSVTAAVDASGGRVDGPNGTFAEIKSGTFPDGALVTIKSVDEASFPKQLDAEQKKEFSYIGGVQLDFGGAVPTVYVNVGVPPQPGDTTANQWIVAQVITAGGVPALNVVDTAKLINGQVRTSSPPCPGVTAAGVYGFYRAAHTVGLNYAQIYASSYGGLRVSVDIRS